MAYVDMACIVMAYVGLAYIGMACIVMVYGSKVDCMPRRLGYCRRPALPLGHGRDVHGRVCRRVGW